MIYDFHTHTFLSDGELSPLELIRRAAEKGYRAIAITDHAGPGEFESFITEISKDCALAEKYWNIKAVPGVELTHLPPSAIDDAAKEAKDMGARLVVVHGETVVEPVEQGTNMAAVKCPYVNILAHPGLLTAEEASMAKTTGIYLEISARKGHSLTNGHVAKIARAAGADMLLGSDLHNEGDLLSEKLAINILRGAGLAEDEIEKIRHDNPQVLLGKLPKALKP